MKKLYPQAAELIEGPYYGHGGPIRSDLKEGVIGKNLLLELKVVEMNSGSPLEGVKVDIWHADPTGRYSGYKNEPDKQPQDVRFQAPINGDVFLRGAQYTDTAGNVRFHTVYPGWYATRAPHIHLKLYQADKCVLTSQLFFPDENSREVFRTDIHYRRAVEQDTFNVSDPVIARAERDVIGCWVHLEKRESEIVGRSILAIDAMACSVPVDAPAGFRPPVGGILHSKSIR